MRPSRLHSGPCRVQFDLPTRCLLRILENAKLCFCQAYKFVRHYSGFNMLDAQYAELLIQQVAKIVLMLPQVVPSM
ncbi:unnamed protein product [Urochloa humidicola]